MASADVAAGARLRPLAIARRSAPRSPTTACGHDARASHRRSIGTDRGVDRRRRGRDAARSRQRAVGRARRTPSRSASAAHPMPRSTTRRPPRHGVHAPARRPGHHRVVRRRAPRRRAAARVGVPREPVRERVRARSSRRSVPPSLGDPAQWQRFAAPARPRRGRPGCARRSCASTLAPVEHELWAEADARRAPAPSAPDATFAAEPAGRSTPRSRASASEAATEPVRRPARSTTTVRPELRAVPEGWTMEYNLADLWERVADTVPDHEALVCADRRLTFAEEDDARDPARQRARRAGRRPRRPRRVLPLQLDRVPRSDARRVQAARGADQRQLPLRRGRAALPLRRRRRARGRVPPRVRAQARRDRAVAPEAAHVSSRSTTAPTPAPDRVRRARLRAGAGRRERRSATSVPARPTTSTSSTPAAPPGCRRA